MNLCKNGVIAQLVKLKTGRVKDMSVQQMIETCLVSVFVLIPTYIGVGSLVLISVTDLILTIRFNESALHSFYFGWFSEPNIVKIK